MSREAKLRWHCRRGMRELDLLLAGFLERRYKTLSAPERDAFERLLDEPNESLADWILEGKPVPDTQFADLVAAIRTHPSAG